MCEPGQFEKMYCATDWKGFSDSIFISWEDPDDFYIYCDACGRNADNTHESEYWDKGKFCSDWCVKEFDEWFRSSDYYQEYLEDEGFTEETDPLNTNNNVCDK